MLLKMRTTFEHTPDEHLFEVDMKLIKNWKHEPWITFYIQVDYPTLSLRTYVHEYTGASLYFII